MISNATTHEILFPLPKKNFFEMTPAVMRSPGISPAIMRASVRAPNGAPQSLADSSQENQLPKFTSLSGLFASRGIGDNMENPYSLRRRRSSDGLIIE